MTVISVAVIVNAFQWGPGGPVLCFSSCSFSGSGKVLAGSHVFLRCNVEAPVGAMASGDEASGRWLAEVRR